MKKEIIDRLQCLLTYSNNLDVNEIHEIEDIIKEMYKTLDDRVSTVTRLEVINHSSIGPVGRAYTNYSCGNLELSFQDNNRTLKIFVNDKLK